MKEGVYIPTLWVPSHGHSGVGAYLRRTRGAAGGITDPADIAGLLLWLDAGQGAFEDAGSDAAEDEDLVQQWNDQSGNGNNASQGTSGNRPTYQTGIVNSLPVIRFDGVDNYLSYSSSLFTYTGARTCFAVVSREALTASDYGPVLAEFSSAQNSIGLGVNVFPNTPIKFATDVYAPGGMSTDDTFSAATFYAVCWQWSNWSTHKSNGDTLITVNGVEEAISAYGDNPAGFTSTLKSIGRFDANAGGSNHFKGDIAEIIVYDSALSEADRQSVETYLLNKYGL